ncbi:MAG: argininosuccinate lyase [Halobacteriaceae archaeon]
MTRDEGDDGRAPGSSPPGADAGEGDKSAGTDADAVVRGERFSGGPARSFMSSLPADRRIFEADLAVDRAHVVMLAEQEIVSEAVAGDVLAALADVEAAGFEALPAGEDVHEAIETAVIDRVGPDGGRMHTARSRNDEVATCIRYRLREDLLDAHAAVEALREALLEAAAGTVETVAPGYTHLQPAQPTTVAHWLLSYESAARRDAARLRDAYDRTNRSPLGAAAFAGTPFDVDRRRTASLLGFDGVVENATDAVSARDVLLESTGALSAAATTLSGLAEDLTVMASKGHVDLDDAYASTSSIMPQKKNPDALELVRAVAGDAAGAQTALTTTLKGLPRAYNRDLQRATPHVWDAVDPVTEGAEVVAGAVATASWPADALESAAGEGFATATGVADRLAMAGLPFRTAHEVVSTAAEATDGDPDVEDVAAALDAVADRDLADLLDPADVTAALDPVESVAMRDSLGGPAPEQTRAAVERGLDRLADDREAAELRWESIRTAADRRRQEVDSYV